MRVNYSALTVIAMADAGWNYRVVRAGKSLYAPAVVAFQTPQNGEEERSCFTGQLPDRDLIALGLRAHRVGKTVRDQASATRGKCPTGHSAIKGPEKGKSGAVDKHGGKHGHDKKKGGKK